MIVESISRVCAGLAARFADDPSTFGSYRPLAVLLDNFRARSGVTVTPTTALTISAVYRAVDLLSDDLAVLPLFVYERMGDGAKRVAREHPVYRLLHERPNPFCSAGRFKRLMQCWALLWGAGRAEIQRNGAGEPVALWPIHPSRCRTYCDTAGNVKHDVINNNQRLVTLNDTDVLHHYKFTTDGITGISVVGRARNSLGLSVSAEDYAGSFFANNATPSGVLEHPGDLGGDPNDPRIVALKRAWAEAYSGANVQGVMVLEEGMKYHAMGMPHKDAQFLETRQFQILEVARWFGVEPHLLMDYSRAHFANIESSDLNHDRHSVMPWANALEEECDLKLLPPDSDMFCEFQMDGLLRADAATRAQVLAIKRRNGVVNANEWRELDNQNPIEGPAGEAYLVPQELTTIEGVMAGINAKKAAATRQNNPPPPTKKEDEPEPSQQTQQHLTAWLAETLSRLSAVDANARHRVEKKNLAAPELSAAMDKLFGEHRDRVNEALSPWLAVAQKAIGVRASKMVEALMGYYDCSASDNYMALAEKIIAAAKGK